ncbi:MAG: nucleotidyltransferase domain-containing protein [Candidatus Omnitrophica bacterium]|nr:nucleotidyltransferase domain-containing protein [Candidatus Omnitrophota bacterium]
MGQKKPTLRQAKAEAMRYLKILNNDGVHIRSAYLFGSFADGRQRTDSDLDLLVSLAGFKNWIEAGGYLHRKLAGFHSRFNMDIIAHSKPRLDAGIPLEGEVLKKGIRLM